MANPGRSSPSFLELLSNEPGCLRRMVHTPLSIVWNWYRYWCYIDIVQSWVSAFLAVYGVTLLLGSRMWYPPLVSISLLTIVALFGLFADRYESRTGSFILGLVALAASTALFMRSTSPVGFIIARALQGFSGSAVWVVGLALIVDTVNDDRIGEAMSYASIGMALGTLFGPTAGGFMSERLGFFKPFYVPIGIIALDIVLRMALLDKRCMFIIMHATTVDILRPYKTRSGTPASTHGIL